MITTSTTARSSSRAGGWTVRIRGDADISDYSPRHFMMLVILEAMCGSKSYCWPSNATLGGRYGCTARTAKSILVEMQAAGILWRLPVDPDRPEKGRAGIFLHRRLDPDRPVEDRPPPPEAVRRLWEARGRAISTQGGGSKSTQGGGSKSTQGGGSKSTQGGGSKSTHPSNKESLSLNETHFERADAALAQRQRPESPEPEAVPGIPAPATAAAAPEPPPPAPGAPVTIPGPIGQAPPRGRASEPPGPPGAPSGALTAGQAEFLASLSTKQRAGLEALAPDRRAEILAPHVAGYDRVIGGEQAQRLSPKAEMPAPPIPRTTAELIEQLPDSPRSWSQMAAEALVQDFGTAKDRRLWGQFVRIAESVRAGALEPAPVLDAYGQAMRPGIKKRGAKFWAALKGLTGMDQRSFHRRE